MLSWAKDKKASIRFVVRIDAKELERYRSKADLSKDVFTRSLNIQNAWFQWEYRSKNIQAAEPYINNEQKELWKLQGFIKILFLFFHKLVCFHD